MNFRTVWKQNLAVYPHTVDLPEDWKPLHVGNQRDVLTLWYETEGAGIKVVPVNLTVVGTGDGFDTTGLQHIGSALLDDNSVWHVYRETPK